MSDIAEFVLARINEEEDSARAMLYGAPVGGKQLVSPARLLAHCAARRRLVALHEIAVVDDGYAAILDGESGSCHAGQNGADYLCPTLRLLAMPYFDHPDFEPSWQRPVDLDVLRSTGRQDHSSSAR